MKKEIKKLNKVICFTRVSTTLQDLESQEREVIAMAKNDGYNDSQIILISEKESGYCLTEDERIGLTQMKKAIEEDAIDCVYCWEVSRIARRLKVIVSISDYLEERKVNLKIKKEGLQLFDCDGKKNPLYTIIMAILGSFAEIERNSIIERMGRTKKMMMHNGQKTSAAIKYGYSIDEDKYFIVNEDEANIIREIFTLYSSGDYTCEKLAKEMNERGYCFRKSKHNQEGKFSRANIDDIISSFSYSGEVRSKGNRDIDASETEGNLYPMIVPIELIEKCNEIKAQKRSVNKGYDANKYNAYCKGLLKDGKDPISTKHNEVMDSYRTMKVRCGVASYSNIKQDISISLNYTDYLVWYATKQYRVSNNTDSGKVADLKDKMNAMVAKLFVVNAELEKVLKRKDKLENDYYVEGKLKEDTYISISKQIDNIIAETERKKNIIEIDIANQKKLIKSAMNDSNITFEDLDQFSEDKKIELIHQVIKEIICLKDGNATISLNIIFFDGSEKKGWFNSKAKKVELDGNDISDGYKPKMERKKY